MKQLLKARPKSAPSAGNKAALAPAVGNAPAIRFLVAESLPWTSGVDSYLPFQTIQMIAGATYELIGIPVDSYPGATTISAGLIAYNRQMNVAGGLPPDLSGTTDLLSFGNEIEFGAFFNYHTRVQVQVDKLTAKNIESTWKVYGGIYDEGNDTFISTVIAQGHAGVGFNEPAIVISTKPSEQSGYRANPAAPNLGSALPGAQIYFLTGTSTNPAYNNQVITASMVGFDLTASF